MNPSSRPGSVAPAFSLKPNATCAGKNLLHRKTSVEILPTRENFPNPHYTSSLYISSLRILLSYPAGDLCLMHLFALNEVFQVICKEGQVLPLLTLTQLRFPVSV